MVGATGSTVCTATTELARNDRSPAVYVAVVHRIVHEGSESPAELVAHHLWATTSPDVLSGRYYEPAGVLGKGSRLASDDALSKRLWGGPRTS
jgi:hypothetical protein